MKKNFKCKNLYGWVTSAPLRINGFEWLEDLSKIDEDFIKSYAKDSDKGYVLELDVRYPTNLHDLHSDLPFTKQASNYGLILEKVHRVIQFNQEAWLKPYIDLNTELRKYSRNDFEKDFL